MGMNQTRQRINQVVGVNDWRLSQQIDRSHSPESSTSTSTTSTRMGQPDDDSLVDLLRTSSSRVVYSESSSQEDLLDVIRQLERELKTSHAENLRLRVDNRSLRNRLQTSSRELSQLQAKQALWNSQSKDAEKNKSNSSEDRWNQGASDSDSDKPPSMEPRTPEKKQKRTDCPPIKSRRSIIPGRNHSMPVRPRHRPTIEPKNRNANKRNSSNATPAKRESPGKEYGTDKGSCRSNSFKSFLGLPMPQGRSGSGSSLLRRARSCSVIRTVIPEEGEEDSQTKEREDIKPTPPQRFISPAVTTRKGLWGRSKASGGVNNNTVGEMKDKEGDQSASEASSVASNSAEFVEKSEELVQSVPLPL